MYSISNAYGDRVEKVHYVHHVHRSATPRGPMQALAGFSLRSLTLPAITKRYCLRPGCSQKTEASYCEQHKQRERPRQSAARRGYDRRWRRFRLWYLARNPLCESCKAKTPPLLLGATDVDHVVPLACGGGRYDLSNLQALCRRCHQQKTSQQTANRKIINPRRRPMGGVGQISGGETS